MQLREQSLMIIICCGYDRGDAKNRGSQTLSGSFSRRQLTECHIRGGSSLSFGDVETCLYELLPRRPVISSLLRVVSLNDTYN